MGHMSDDVPGDSVFQLWRGVVGGDHQGTTGTARAQLFTTCPYKLQRTNLIFLKFSWQRWGRPLPSASILGDQTTRVSKLRNRVDESCQPD